MSRVVLVDNFDSFTHNLAQALAKCGAHVHTVRNDALSLDDLERLDPTHLVISPGPGRPEHAGITPRLVEAWLGRIPLLGVCLGHQALVQALGGTVGHAPEPVHGKASWITHDGTGIFTGISSPMQVGRYHSLVATHVPDALEICARTDAVVMGVRARGLRAHGVQFHPESLLTPSGEQLLANFLHIPADPP